MAGDGGVEGLFVIILFGFFVGLFVCKVFCGFVCLFLCPRHVAVFLVFSETGAGGFVYLFGAAFFSHLFGWFLCIVLHLGCVFSHLWWRSAMMSSGCLQKALRIKGGGGGVSVLSNILTQLLSQSYYTHTLDHLTAMHYMINYILCIMHYIMYCIINISIS